jgi:hypothetical protein
MIMSLVLEPLSSALTAEAPDVVPPTRESLMKPPAPAQAPTLDSTTPGGPPTELSADEGIWSSRKRRLARSAARAALVVPGVAEADFTIMGTASRPSLLLTCVLRPQADAAAVMEHIESTVVGDLELLMGVPFAQRQIEFSVGRG